MSILNDKEITAIDDGAANQFPAQVDAPPPPKSEQQRHTGARNLIDPHIYKQNVKIRSVNWSVTDERGKVLAVIEVHPDNMGAFVEYLQGMYHYWSGGVLIEVRVMGTAYQAGQIVLVEIPPEADAYAIAASGDYTGYNWVALDVKDPALVGMHCRDVNQGAFHYVSKENAFGPLNIGSQFLLVVDSPLNSTTGGTQQVGIEIWAKPSQEFQFSRLRIPRASNSTSLQAPAELEMALNFPTTGEVYMCNNAQPVKRMRVFPSSVKIYNTVFYGAAKLSGEYYYREWSHYEAARFKELKDWDPTNLNAKAKVSGLQSNIDAAVYPWYSTELTKGGGGFITLQAGTDDVIVTMSKDSYDNFQLYPNTLVRIPLVVYRGSPLNRKIGTSFTCPVDESIMVYAPSSRVISNKQDAPQTDILGKVLHTGVAKNWLPKNMCASFMMVDSTEEVPIGLVKLWEEGIFTTRASKDFIDYDVAKLKFYFKGFVPRIQKLQSDPQLAQGKLLVQMKHARSLRHEGETQITE